MSQALVPAQVAHDERKWGVVRIHNAAGYAMATSWWFPPRLLLSSAALALGALRSGRCCWPCTRKHCRVWGSCCSSRRSRCTSSGGCAGVRRGACWPPGRSPDPAQAGPRLALLTPWLFQALRDESGHCGDLAEVRSSPDDLNVATSPLVHRAQLVKGAQTSNVTEVELRQVEAHMRNPPRGYTCGRDERRSAAEVQITMHTQRQPRWFLLGVDGERKIQIGDPGQAGYSRVVGRRTDSWTRGWTVSGADVAPL